MAKAKPSQQKRARERARQERQKEKELRRQENRARRAAAGPRQAGDEDPDIAPGLVPLRERLMSMVHRPVNIQGTRDFVMYLRGELIGQPYLTLIEKRDTE